MNRVTAFYQDVTRVKADIFIAGITMDMSPPKGLVGRVDWYLRGFISRQVLDGKLNAGEGEMTLVALQNKLFTPRILMVGLGREEDLNSDSTAASFSLLGGIVRDLGVGRVALEIPAVEVSGDGPYKILRETMRGFQDAFEEGEKRAYCEIQLLARTEEESESWRRVVKGLLR